MDDIPSWRDAPVWAEWLAMDSDGRWHWFASMPGFRNGDWSYEYDASELRLYAGQNDIYSKAMLSLQKRPTGFVMVG